MPELILGFVGQAGCGKGTAADLLRGEYDAGYYRFSSILSDILKRLGLDASRDHYIRLSETLRHTFGEDLFSYAIEKDAVMDTRSIIVIDGIRRPEDIVALEPLPQFKLIAIDASPKVRYERMKARGEKTGEQNLRWETFLAQEEASTEITIPAVMKRATMTLSNEGTREAFEEQVHLLMRQLGHAKHV